VVARGNENWTAIEDSLHANKVDFMLLKIRLALLLDPFEFHTAELYYSV
jgi:hypothetical protein